MAQWLRQNTAVKFHLGPAVGTGGLAAVTSLKASNVTALRIVRHNATVVVSVSAANMFHVSGGHYYVPLTSVHTNTLGHFRLYVRASGTTKALPFWKDGQIIPTNVFDSLVSSSAKLNVGTLSSGAAVWTATPRTLTSGAAVASSVWTRSVRLLTSGAAVASSVWVRTTRTLTSGASVASSVWTRSVRLLTSGLAVEKSVWLGTTVRSLSTAGVVWTANARTLTSAAVVWTAAGRRTLYESRNGTLASATANTALLDAGAPTTSSYFKGQTLLLTSGVGSGQAAVIILYSTGRRATITPAWKTTPNNATKFTVYPASWALLISGTHTGSILPTVSTVSKLLANADKTGYSLATAGVVWTANARTLTSGAAVASSVWARSVRTLTSGAAVASSVWVRSTRLLTSGAAVASSVWVRPTRTLTSGATVASSVWVRSTRTLTSGAAVASSVWTRSTRTLTSAGVVWTANQTELGAVPAAAPQAGQAMMFLYMSSRNKRITTATGDKVHTSATAVIATAPLSATSTVFTKNKYA